MTRTAIFDIETDGLLDQLTVIHSLCIRIKETGEKWSCTDNSPGGGINYSSIREGLNILSEATELVGHNIIKFDIPAIKKVYPDWTSKAEIFDTLIAARVIFPDIKEIDFARRAKIEAEQGPVKRDLLWPTHIIGRQSLDSWGIRLGEWKGDYFKAKTQELRDQFEAVYRAARDRGLKVADCPPKLPSRDEIATYAWGTWNPEMQSYCEQDVVVTEKLYDMLRKKALPGEYLRLEHDFAVIINMMEQEGFSFDVPSAQRLEVTLRRRLAEISDELQAAFPPWVETTEHIAGASNKTLGRVKGEVYHKRTEHIFNAGSRDHIAARLAAKYGWVPVEMTETGKPKVDEDVLKRLTYPEAALLTEAMMISKRLGQLADGKQAWLNLVTPEGKIHGTVDTNGAITGRCTHKNPNVGQVPGPKSPYGKECRALWGPPKGKVQIGADASGLELRCFGHFVAVYDEGAYIKVILDGDIHSFNAASLFGYEVAEFEAGLADKETLFSHVASQHPAHGPRFARTLTPEGRVSATIGDYFKFLRENAKTFIYGFLYGAGAGKIGEIVEGTAEDGTALIAAFLGKLPALTKLRQTIDKLCNEWVYERIAILDRDGNVVRNADGSVKTRSSRKKNPHYRGFLKGIDGRRLPVRSAHSALNTLLQSAGAVIVKKATVLIFNRLTEEGFVWGRDWAFMAHVHDEVQLWANPEDAERIGAICVWAFEEAGRHFNFNCPITGEFKIGNNWYDTH